MYVPLAFSVVSLIAGGLALTVPFALHAQTPPTCTLVANPAVVVQGLGFTLSLISTGATSASIDNGIGSIAPNGSRPSISISVTTQYTATVTGSGGSATCSTTVIVDGTSGGRDLGVGGAGGSGGGGGGGGGPNPAQLLQGAGQILGGLGQLQNALGGNNAQNSWCNPVYPTCPCGRVPIGQQGCTAQRATNGCCAGDNRYMCPVGSCSNNTNGFITKGQCTRPNYCHGVSSGGGSGAQGGGQQGLGGGLQALGSILQGLSSLMGGGAGGGSGSGAGAGAGNYQYPPGCSQYYYTATTTSDPCAIYQPNYNDYYTNNPLIPDVSDSLFDDYVYPTTPTPISDLIDIDRGTGGVAPEDSDGSDKKDGVLENLRKGFSTVAGLFGGDTLERACLTRPWAGDGALAGIAPDSFFDDLCRRAGYTNSFGNGGNLNGSFGSGGSGSFESGTTTNIAVPTAEIRAEPPAVRLGTRTYIFWSSDYVTSCSVTGPSFTQNTLFGAGATVPITGPTSFVINCVAPDGTMVSDSVTVNLAI